MSVPQEAEDDKSILDEDRLLCRIRANQLMGAGGGFVFFGGDPRSTLYSAVFKAEEFSVNIESLMVRRGRPSPQSSPTSTFLTL